MIISIIASVIAYFIMGALSIIIHQHNPSMGYYMRTDKPYIITTSLLFGPLALIVSIIMYYSRNTENDYGFIYSMFNPQVKIIEHNNKIDNEINQIKTLRDKQLKYAEDAQGATEKNIYLSKANSLDEKIYALKNTMK